MKIITFATLKGGAGKTMNCFNVAGVVAEGFAAKEAAQYVEILNENTGKPLSPPIEIQTLKKYAKAGFVAKSKKVLLVDLDPQGNLSTNCGIRVSDEDSYSVRDIFDNIPSEQPDPDVLIIKSPIKELPNLDILPSNIYLFVTEKDLVTKSDRERIFQKYLAKHKEYFEKYDFIFIDTNPSMSTINYNGLLVADEIILSCDVSENSLKGAEVFCLLWDRTRLELGKEDNVSAMIISNYDGRSNLAKDLKEYVFNESDVAKNIVLDTIITSAVKLKETEVRHKPINILAPKQKACKQYKAAVAELYERKVLE